MKKFLSVFLAIFIAISLPAEAGKRSGGFGGHGWGKSSHSSHIKLKKKNTKKKFIAGAAGAGAVNSASGGSNDVADSDYKKISKDTHWADHEKLNEHFKKHGSDFNASDAKDYAKKANSFYATRKNKSVRQKIDNKGVVRLWNPNTNEFGSYTREGQTKTYFKPSSQSYWDRQMGRETNE